MVNPSEILEFWQRIGPAGWWEKNDEVDKEIVNRFSTVHQQASAGELSDWVNEPESALALVITLDQFSRNMFRNDVRSFSSDPLAKKYSIISIAKAHDQSINPHLRTFFYMPFMHSELILDQEKCVRLMHREGGPGSLNAALVHRNIIARFGRFPHRNSVLGRHTTPAEQYFLDKGGFKG